MALLPQIDIRHAVEEDVPALLSLLKHLDVGEDAFLSLEEARAIFRRTAKYPDYRIYAALAGERLIGTFGLLVIESIAHGGAPHGLIEDVVVDPAWRRRGIGKKMMDFAMQRCREKGCYKVALSSHLSRDRTHAFYESLGFARHGYSFLVGRHS